MNNNLQCPALPSQHLKKDKTCSRFFKCTLPAKTICEAKRQKKDWQ